MLPSEGFLDKNGFVHKSGNGYSHPLWGSKFRLVMHTNPNSNYIAHVMQDVDNMPVPSMAAAMLLNEEEIIEAIEHFKIN